MQRIAASSFFFIRLRRWISNLVGIMVSNINNFFQKSKNPKISKIVELKLVYGPFWIPKKRSLSRSFDYQLLSCQIKNDQCFRQKILKNSDMAKTWNLEETQKGKVYSLNNKPEQEVKSPTIASISTGCSIVIFNIALYVPDSFRRPCGYVDLWSSYSWILSDRSRSNGL